MTTQIFVNPSDHLREISMPVWQRITEHPYLTELKNGTLPIATFRGYVQQDWLYLQEFARTVAVIAGRASDPEVMKFLLNYVEPLVTMEYHFHRKHAERLDLDFDNVTWEMNEANWAYTRHMLAAAHAGTTAEALAALLPCPCVYAYVARTLVEGPRSPEPMYAEWIDFYAPGRIDTVESDGGTLQVYDRDKRIAALEALYDRVAAHQDDMTLARCERNYLISSRYEWWFWDTAYRRHMWVVG